MSSTIQIEAFLAIRTSNISAKFIVIAFDIEAMTAIGTGHVAIELAAIALNDEAVVLIGTGDITNEHIRSIDEEAKEVIRSGVAAEYMPFAKVS